MATLNPAARRAIAIRASIKRRQAQAATPAAANDNKPSARVRGGARVMTTACMQACVEAAGFSEHAA